MTQKQIVPANETDTDILEELSDIEEIVSPIFESDETMTDIPPEIERVIELFTNPTLALMILDNNLTILYCAPQTALLFQDYYTISKKPFFNIFNQKLEQEEMKNFIVSLRSFESGYSWTGTLKHKTPKTKTLYTRTSIVPFFDQSHTPVGYQVVFENITEKYHSQLRTTFNSILEASKLKDNDTGLHNERVSYYCKKMAEYLYESQLYPQIDPDFIENIGFLAAMHDVGKIGTPDYILQKPGKLTDLEWDIMREHTINGTFILSSYPVLMAKEIALSHHEWWNGSGYPFKLEGDMIPLSARIVTIADVYDALRMKRSYKNEFTHEESIQKIIAGGGTQFDPALTRVFEQIHSDFDEIWNLLKDTENLASVNRDRSKEFSESL